ncbi:bifunctional hydroxymethylpyrimidine kinase/phosphomethylpyrimidine kinase [Inmirania thermothiophila]|uniref:hydroxymethylpyrimidine kinase n=1 Tax=Inmirania thermothiophila TaxID=1750597 RepID=A0A3N1Y7J9_9GAMM|nr:hydroxymethylpyrimidine/phosphomethylpyrimidine kinase [Inmirania thermothiophila]ROR34794.1 hydroxymethylpyrimidine/phosphomethylpyrimidine kinase [Inmirania thermothiophila]
MSRTVPVVLVFAGHDPSGGAGLAADIEAVASMGAHAAPVATAVTVQDTRRVQRFEPLPPALVAEQARAVVEDLPVAAVKIGMVGSAANAAAVAAVLADLGDVPVVLDPVLAGGGGGSLAGEEVREALLALLVPRATVLTPNSEEARALAPEADSLEACAQQLLAAGAELVLLTGTHEPTEHVVNRLWGNLRLLERFTWERLPGSYHGSGCTLASAIAGLLAQGLEPFTAIHEAQEYTWEALRAGYRPGRGQHLPNRLFWAFDRGETS